jgi:nucleoside-diphosphate-sugar epimerase
MGMVRRDIFYIPAKLAREMTSKILVIGATGLIGKVLVEESAKSGHATFALVREASLSDPVKAQLVERFKDLGVTILYVRSNPLLMLVHVLF